MKTLKTPVKWLLSSALAVGAAGFLTHPAGAAALPEPQVANSDVAGNSAIYYDIRFQGGEPAVAKIVSSATTVLHVIVYDGNGNVIVSGSDDGTGLLTLRWHPLWTGNFRIRVVNTGPFVNSYHLQTN